MRSRLFSRLLLSAVLATALCSRNAAAHNAAHAAVAILGVDAQGVNMVRLTHGLAYRTDDGFRFVCPEVWGGEIAAPSSAIPGGPAVVAAEQLHLIESNGRISAHPNHRGAGIALARNRDALFGLFNHQGRVELRRITPNASELVHAFDEPFSALAADDDKLSVLRASGGELVMQWLSLQGALRERVAWREPSKIATAELRSDGDALYVTLVHSTAPWVTLGQITSGGYEQLRSANSGLLGPVSLASENLVARDGSLESLASGSALAPGTFIECLDAFAGVRYACVGDGLTEVSSEGLVEPLFDITALREPDYGGLSEQQRESCDTRWRDLRDHLLREGRIAAEPRDVEGASEQAAAPDEDRGSVAAANACALGAAPTSSRGVSSLLCLAVLVLRLARRSGSGSRARGCTS